MIQTLPCKRSLVVALICFWLALPRVAGAAEQYTLTEPSVADADRKRRDPV